MNTPNECSFVLDSPVETVVRCGNTSTHSGYGQPGMWHHFCDKHWELVKDKFATTRV